MAKRNNGIAEPEHRLLTSVIPVMLGSCANVGFGQLAKHYLVTNPGGLQPHWFSLSFLYAIFFMAFGGVLEVTYTYLASTTTPSYSLAIMTIVFIIRDVASFDMSYGVSRFSSECGYDTSYGVYGILYGLFGLCGVFIYIYGAS